MIVDIFAQLAEHTRPACASCRVPYACCSAQQCQATARMAREDLGTDLAHLVTDHPTLPFMGPDGCVVAPHLRPICAVHVCGQHLTQDAWSARYWDLREAAGEALEAMLARADHQDHR